MGLGVKLPGLTRSGRLWPLDRTENNADYEDSGIVTRLPPEVVRSVNVSLWIKHLMPCLVTTIVSNHKPPLLAKNANSEELWTALSLNSQTGTQSSSRQMSIKSEHAGDRKPAGFTLDRGMDVRKKYLKTKLSNDNDICNCESLITNNIWRKEQLSLQPWWFKTLIRQEGKTDPQNSLNLQIYQTLTKLVEQSITLIVSGVRGCKESSCWFTSAEKSQSTDSKDLPCILKKKKRKRKPEWRWTSHRGPLSSYYAVKVRKWIGG